jgi:uncharacterized protein YdaU (DUF1376 family)
MTNRNFPMMPWFPQDFASATSGYAFAERALYRELLDAQWMLGKLPADEKRLARIARMDPDEFAEAWREVKSKFVLVGGCYVNERLEEHRAKAERLHAQRMSASQASAAARGERKPSERSTARRARREHLSPSPSPSLKEEDTSRAAHASANGHAANAELELLKAAYPRRSGDQRWHDAEKAIRARLKEGHTWQEIIAGAQRYAAWCDSTGKTGTETVKQAATFCGPGKAFLEPWVSSTWRPDPADDPPEHVRG